MEIKTEEELQKVLNGFIKIPVYYTENVDGSRIYIDKDSIEDEFKQKLKEIVDAVKNF